MDDLRHAYFPYANYLSLAAPPPLASIQVIFPITTHGTERRAQKVQVMAELREASEAESAGEEKGARTPDPFAPEATIPLPFQLGDEYGYYGPTAIWKRNERERHRVRCVNEGYEKLRTILPAPDGCSSFLLSCPRRPGSLSAIGWAGARSGG